MTQKVIGWGLSLVLMLGLATPALASAEMAIEEPASEEIVWEAAETQEETEQAELMTESLELETQEGEEPDVTTEELPVSEQTLLGDPEDPLYARYVLSDGVMALTLDGASYGDFTPRALEGEVLHKGIDVSAWQGSINWEKVKASGVEFVFIRVAYRTIASGTLAEDGRWKTFFQGAQSAGLKIGVYIFSQAITVEEGKEEAQYVLDLIEGLSLDLPVVLDYEYAANGRLQNAKLTKRVATDICLAFCQTIEAAGYDSMVYANPDMLKNQLYPQELGRLWLAHYTSKTTYTTSAYEFWQCSDSGTVDGISGSVDLDFWFEPMENPFTDVSSGDWYYNVVLNAYGQSVVKGMTATAFSPNTTASRGQVITMLHRMLGEPAYTTTASFTDLKQDYYKAAVYWATENGVVQGQSSTSFAPDKPITRQDLATILYRLAGSPTVTQSLSGYSDAGAISSYAKNAMAWAVKTGILTGYEDNTLKPLGQATRAEVCAMLMRYQALGL
jgi:GH25 family lysozyme M1 (1,4-beta-N-acetylmuramidase)